MKYTELLSLVHGPEAAAREEQMSPELKGKTVAEHRKEFEAILSSDCPLEEKLEDLEYLDNQIYDDWGISSLSMAIDFREEGWSDPANPDAEPPQLTQKEEAALRKECEAYDSLAGDICKFQEILSKIIEHRKGNRKAYYIITDDDFMPWGELRCAEQTQDGAIHEAAKIWDELDEVTKEKLHYFGVVYADEKFDCESELTENGIDPEGWEDLCIDWSKEWEYKDITIFMWKDE